MKSTVQNGVFRNWIRKKWIFVRIQFHFFVLQPYVGGIGPWEPLQERPWEPLQERPWEPLQERPWEPLQERPWEPLRERPRKTLRHAFLKKSRNIRRSPCPVRNHGSYSAGSAHFLRRPYENASGGSIRPIAKRLEWPDAVTIQPKAEW